MPTEPRSEYADGPGDDTPAVDSFACSWPWKTFAACSRDDEPKPKEGAEPRELSGCEPNIERVPIFEAEAVLMVAGDRRGKGDERRALTAAAELTRGVASAALKFEFRLRSCSALPAKKR